MRKRLWPLLRSLPFRVWVAGTAILGLLAAVVVQRLADRLVPPGTEETHAEKLLGWVRDMLTAYPIGWMLLAAAAGALVPYVWEERRRWIGALRTLPHLVKEKPRQSLRSWLGIDGAVRATTSGGAVVFPPRVIIADRPPTMMDSGPIVNPPMLTEDQRQFRIALKQFSLTSVPELLNGVGRVFAVLSSKEKEFSAGSPQSRALHFFAHFMISSNINQTMIMELAQVDLQAVEVETLQRELVAFLNGYGWRQHAVAHLNEILKQDLEKMEFAVHWFAADRKAAERFENLLIWPEASQKLKSQREEFATIGKKWKQPIAINY